MDPKIVKLLEENGFQDVKSAEKRRFSPYDFKAFQKGKLCFIEARVRSPQATTQFFTFRDSKIKHLAELEKVGSVYIILLNKYGHRILTLDELLSGKHKDVQFFKYKSRDVYYWKEEHWGKGVSARKTKRIVIRYDSDLVAKRFKRFAADYKDFQAALKMLLDLGEEKGYVLRK